jgi:lysozyme family protein
VPAGRPLAGHPPFTWEESAIDALMMLDLHTWRDWSPAGTAYVWEAYNGFGYRLFHPQVNSPYLWSFTTAYGPPESKGGKYIGDGS